MIPAKKLAPIDLTLSGGRFRVSNLKNSCSLIILPRWAMGRTRPLPRCCPVKITRPNLPFNKKFQRYKHDTNGIFFGLLA